MHLKQDFKPIVIKRVVQRVCLLNPQKKRKRSANSPAYAQLITWGNEPHDTQRNESTEEELTTGELLLVNSQVHEVAYNDAQSQAKRAEETKTLISRANETSDR